MIVDEPGIAGDLKKFKVSMNGIDITGHAVDVKIFQDIFTPAWSSTIMIDDRVNLLSTLSIGDEFEIELETNLDPGTFQENFIFKKLRLYRIDDRVISKSRDQVAKLHLISNHFIVNNYTRVVDYWKEKIIMEIVADLLGNLPVEQILYPDEVPYTLTVPNWSPLTAIEWVTKVALLKGLPQFFLFEQEPGKLTWIDHERMSKRYVGVEMSQKIDGLKKSCASCNNNEDEEMSDEVIETLSNAPAGSVTSGTKAKEPEQKTDWTTKIKRYEIIPWNGLTHQGAGTFNAQVNMYDPKEKVWSKHTSGLVSAPGFDEAPTNISFQPNSENLYFSGNTTPNDTVELWNTQRKQIFHRMNYETLIVQFNGGPGWAKKLGWKVKIDLTSQNADDTDEQKDSVYSGDYLIIGMNHIIINETYTINLILHKLP